MTPRFKAAWEAAPSLLDAVGFDGSGSEFIQYWTLGKDRDHEFAALACEEAEAHVAIAKAEREAF